MSGMNLKRTLVLEATDLYLEERRLSVAQMIDTEIEYLIECHENRDWLSRIFDRILKKSDGPDTWNSPNYREWRIREWFKNDPYYSKVEKLNTLCKDGDSPAVFVSVEDFVPICHYYAFFSTKISKNISENGVDKSETEV